MSSGSFKELSKVLNLHIPSANLPLPDDLIQTIQAYLDKHNPVEDSDSQRLHDELHNIYQREVKNKTNRYAIFIAICRQLRVALAGSSARFLRWWEPLIIPVLNLLADEKGLLAETHGFLLEILAYDIDDGNTSGVADTSAVLSEKLMHMWLYNSRLASSGADPAAQFLEEQVRLVLMDFGKKRPKALLATINKFLVVKEYRAEMLSFLGEFIRYDPPHLHQLLETPLFDNILLCLQIDTSVPVLSLALTALTMLLPHIPRDIAAHLPTLFNVYCRLLFLDRERTASLRSRLDHMDLEKVPVIEDEEKENTQWDKLSELTELNDKTAPDLLNYFTFLYGLYPINFMSYIRKPERYLRHANYQGGDDIEVQPTEIRQRSELFRQVHLLHPNFFAMTIESELTDPNRWMNSDAADVVAVCLALCEPLNSFPSNQAEAPQHSMPPDTPKNPGIDGDVPSHPLLDPDEETNIDSHRVSSGESHTSWRNTTSTIVDSSGDNGRPLSEERKVSIPLEDSPTLGPVSVRPESRPLPPQLLLTTSQEELEESRKFPVTLQQSLPNESQISFTSSQQREPSVTDSYLQSLEQNHVPCSPSSHPSPTEDHSNVTDLHREILLLKNELNFERYLKQQHLSHIGQLRRKYVKEATAEAETQNLINSNKSLRSKLEEAKNTMAQMKRESDKSRTQSKKWEAELTVKLRALKEDQKKWNTETETLRREFEKSFEDNEALKQLIVKSEREELASRQKVLSIETNVDELGRLRTEVDKLAASIRTYEAREFEIERAYASEALAVTKAEILEMKLKAAQNELEKAKLQNDREMETLRSELERNKPDRHIQQSKEYQSLLDNALAMSRSRLAEAEKAHAHLFSKYTNLQAQLLTLKDHARDSDEPLLSGAGIHYHFEGSHSYSAANSPEERRVRRRGLSDPDIVDRGGRSFSPPSEGSGTYFHARPTRVETSSTSPRPSSQHEIRSPSSRIGNSDLIHHSRSGSADSTQPSQPLDIEPITKQKIKPQSDIRVYGRGGVQNVGTAPKDKKKDKKKDEDKSKKVPGFRGIRGLP